MGINIKKALKTGIEKLLASQGYELVKKTLNQNLNTMDSAFRGIARRKHFFNTVVDVGASNGSWTKSIMEYVPPCQYLLIEAQPVHEKALRQFSSEHNNVHCVLAAAGETSGRIYFDATDPFGGQASYTPYASNSIQVPVITIDNEIRSNQLIGPYLIKLDTHGFEVPILKGASRTLAETDVIIIECYNFKIASEGLLFFEMCDYLKKRGFRCIDLVNSLHRPYDGSLWQMDLIFVKDNRPEFSYSEYQ
jgi:FkbM family methyltransferase